MSELTPTAPTPGPPDGVNPPEDVSDHKLLRRIGRGAYGEVWLARSVTEAFRAVKIVRRGSFDHDRPFEREFEGILKFEPISRNHDSQVDILHVGRGEGYFYYVMELADDQATGGQIHPENYQPRTLKSELVFHGRLPFEECLSIGIALATALEHLHHNGLVHRDVKPSNIIFVNGVAKLADIGLVTGMDTTRSYVGTEGFAAPEGAGTPQADLFSLGKVLYEMSTGKDRQEFPELPTNLRELPDREGLAELNAVIARSCRHDPRDRYASAAAMRRDLELLQSGKSLARLHRMERRFRMVSRLGLVGGAAAVLVAVAWWYQSLQTREARRLATHNQQLMADMTLLANEKAKVAEENRERLVRLNIANGVRQLPEDPAAAFGSFVEALPLLTNRPSEEALHRIRMQQVLQTLPVPLQVLDMEHGVVAGNFSADGKLLVIVSSTGEMRICETATGAVRWTNQTDYPIGQVRFTRDGRHLLMASSRPPNSSRLDEWSGLGGAQVLDWRSNRTVFSQIFAERAEQGLTNRLRAVFSPDDRWLAYVSSNHTIDIVEVQSGQVVLNLSGHTDAVNTLAFNANGSVLASGSDDRTARLWHLPSGEAFGRPLLHSNVLERVSLSDSGNRLATVSSGPDTNRIVRFWDTISGTELRLPLALTVEYMCNAAFADPLGKRALIGADTGRKERRSFILDLETGQEMLFSRSITPRCWVISPDKRGIAIGSDGGIVAVVSSETGDLLFPAVINSGWVESLSWSPDSSRLLATRASGTAVMLKLQRPPAALERRFDTRISRQPRRVFQKTFKAHRGRLSVPLKDRTLLVIDLGSFGDVQVLGPVATNAGFVAESSDGRHWAAMTLFESNKGWRNEFPPEAVDLWREEQGALRHWQLPHPTKVGECRFDGTSTYLLTHCGDQRIRFWRTAGGQLERTVPLPAGVKREVAIFPDGKTVLLRWRDDSQYQLFDLVTETLIGRRLEGLGSLVDIDFDLDGGRFATASTERNSGRIWNTRTGAPLTPLLMQSGDIRSVVWSPDRRQVITAGLSATTVWDAQTGERALPNLGDRTSDCSHWSPDGRILIVPVMDRGVQLFDAATAEALTPPLMCDGYVRLARIAGNHLIILSDPNILQSWRLKPTQMATDILQDYAQLVAARRVNSNGVSIPLKPRQLAELCRSLKSRAPELFSE